MSRLRAFVPLVVTVVADGIAVSGAFVLYYVLRFRLGLLVDPTWVPLVVVGPAALTTGFWLLAFAAGGLYRDSVIRRFDGRSALRAAKVVAVGLLVLFFVLFVDAATPGAGRLTLPIYAGMVWSAVAVGRRIVGRLSPWFYRHGVALVPIAVVGERRRVAYVAGELRSRPELGYAPVLVVAIERGLGGEGRMLVAERKGSTERVVRAVEDLRPGVVEGVVAEAVASTHAREILVVLGPDEQALYFTLVRAASRLAVPLRFVGNYRPILGERSSDDPLSMLQLPPALTNN